MKRKGLFILSISMISISLFGCETANENSVLGTSTIETTQSVEGQSTISNTYHLTVEGNDNYISPDLPQEGDYEAGYLFNFKVKIVTDVSFYAYLNGERLSVDHSDDSLGGYDHYQFNMPAKDSTLTISSDLFYVQKEYSFSEVFPETNYITMETLKGVELESGYIGVNPETADPDIEYSEDKTDLEKHVNFLRNEKLVKCTDQMIDGGSYKKLTYTVDDGYKQELYFANGIITYRSFSDSIPFKLCNKDSIPGIEHSVEIA